MGLFTTAYNGAKPKEYSSVTKGFLFECLLKCGLKAYLKWTEESVI